MAETGEKFLKASITRYDIMPKWLKVIFFILSIGGVGLFIFYMMGWSIHGYVLASTAYYYLLFAVFGFCVFVAMPMRKKDKEKVPWYDIVIASFVFGFCLFCFFKAEVIMEIGWVPPPSTLLLVLATIFSIVALESGRRMGGKAFLIRVPPFIRSRQDPYCFLSCHKVVQG